VGAYGRAVVLGHEELAERAINELLDVGASWQEIFLRVLAPTLQQVGDLWERGELSIAAEHAATAFTHRVMHRLALRPRLEPAARTGTVVVACLEGELHALGAEMVAHFFRAAGWEVHYLGPNLPGAELLGVVRSLLPDAVALSVTQDETEPALRRFAEAFRELRGGHSRPLLIAGGQWIVRHPHHGLPFDIAQNDLPRAVAEASRSLHAEAGAQLSTGERC
jgi:methanogenic corrinoid protein MtbC1